MGNAITELHSKVHTEATDPCNGLYMHQLHTELLPKDDRVILIGDA